MDKLCHFCLELDGTGIGEDHEVLAAVQDIFSVYEENLNICTSCRNNIIDFHVFFLVVQANLATFDDIQRNVCEEDGSEAETSAVEEDLADSLTKDLSKGLPENLFKDEPMDIAEENPEKIYEKTSEKNGEKDQQEVQEETDDYDETEDELQLSETEINGSERFVCGICKKQFKIQNTLIVHINEQHIKRCICTICGRSFHSANYLKSHVDNVHQKADKETNGKALVCEECGKTFLNKKSYQYHRQFGHTESETVHECGKCGEGCPSREALKAHEQTHKGGYLFKCDFCPYQANYRKNLKAHVRGRHHHLSKEVTIR